MTANDPDILARLAALERDNEALQQKVAQYEQEEGFYRRLYENAPVGMYELDFESGRCVSVNQTVLDYTGYTRDEFLAMDPVTFLTDESRRRFLERYEKIRRGEPVPPRVEFQIKVKDGRIIWALLEIRFLRRQGRISGASVVLYDIDARKRAYQALVESEERFRRLVDTMNEGLVILDDEGRILYVNKQLEHVSGYRSEELVGHGVHEFLSPETSQLIHRRLSGQGENRQAAFEVAWQRKSGERLYSIVSPQILETAEGGRRTSFAVVTDITPKKKAENVLRRREKELREKNLRLEEMNTALQTLVKLREKDKLEIERAVSTHLKRLVGPLVEKLRSSGLSERQKLYIDLLSSNLEELASSCDSGFASQMMVLTPAETEVANLVRHGRTTKEIASLMNISVRTVDMHRLNIRRKLGLHRKGTNLRSFLLST